MTIEITQPEVEALIQQRLQSGAFKSAEDVILHALRSSEPDHLTGADLIHALQASPYRVSSRTFARSSARTGCHVLMAWLLDTNILSELRKPRPEPKVEAFIAANRWNSFISAWSLLPRFDSVLSVWAMPLSGPSWGIGSPTRFVQCSIREFFRSPRTSCSNGGF